MAVSRRQQRSRGWWLMPVTLVIAVVLDVLPLPVIVESYRPPWVTLILIYWCLFEPRRTGPFTGWSVGLVMDVLQFTLLGMHAMAKTVVAYLVFVFTQRVQMYNGTVQITCVALLLAIDALIISWVQGVVGQVHLGWRAFLPVATGTVVWPFLVAALHSMRPIGYVR